MDSLTSPRVSDLPTTLHREAETSDRVRFEEMKAKIASPAASIGGLVADLLADERDDYRPAYVPFVLPDAGCGNAIAVKIS